MGGHKIEVLASGNIKPLHATGWRASRNPETVESHQSSQDIVSPMPARADSRPVSTE